MQSFFHRLFYFIFHNVDSYFLIKFISNRNLNLHKASVIVLLPTRQYLKGKLTINQEYYTYTKYPSLSVWCMQNLHFNCSLYLYHLMHLNS